MAEIKIEKKKPVWPWVVALLLIGAIIYYMFLRNDEAQPVREVEVENTTITDTIN
ncbi:hypothetical protein [Flavobacterium phragmitis]|uniref:Uncharacterized protein n=1 Tax=Flavobacterium phragmitis TaxID=739143 RepID=A0A1I1SX01_9FLAO|nr:hypothetical protein [Flavobacterium phragmitis]SFD50892.1 hypothetical protein SAMN05216297_108255 [Flavobacterium phragmitis]